MGVVRDWGGGVARAGTVALLVPLALAIGVGLTAAVGGGQRLRALTQVLGGPVPRFAGEGARLEPGGRLPPVPVFPRQAAVAAPAAGAPAAAPGSARTPSSPAPGAAAPSTGAPTPAAPAAPQGSATPAPAAPAPATPARPDPVRDTGTAVADAAGTLPVPAGPIVHDAVQAVVDLVAPPR